MGYGTAKALWRIIRDPVAALFLLPMLPEHAPGLHSLKCRVLEVMFASMCEETQDSPFLYDPGLQKFAPRILRRLIPVLILRRSCL